MFVRSWLELFGISRPFHSAGVVRRFRAEVRIRPCCYPPRSLWRQVAVGGTRQRLRPRSSKDSGATMISPDSSCSTHVWRRSSRTAFVRNRISWVTPCLSSAWRPHTCKNQEKMSLVRRGVEQFAAIRQGITFSTRVSLHVGVVLVARGTLGVPRS